MTCSDNVKNDFYLERKKERIERLNSKPWRERMTSFNLIKHKYVDRGVSVEQFLTDYPDSAKRNNITIDDLLYITNKIEEMGTQV